jgi:hypothetical protein
VSTPDTTSPTGSRSVQVSESLLSAMARDTATYALTRPAAIVAWIVLTLALLTTIGSLITVSAAGSEAAGELAWMPPLILLVMAMLVMFTVMPVRRALRAAMPAGSTVSARNGAEHVHVTSSQGRSSIPFSTFRSIRVGQNAVLLQLRGTSVATALPREIISDEDITRLRAAIR